MASFAGNMRLDPLDLLESMDGVALLLDRQLIIRHIGWANWDSFWTKNGGKLDGSDIIGRDITSFFSEGEVRDVYRELLLEWRGACAAR